MNLTVAECYTAYLDELRRYKAWFDETVEKYHGNRAPMASWGDHDYARVTEWNAELKAIERVLGLTPMEVETGSVSVGIETERTRKQKELMKLEAELAPSTTER